MCAVQVEDEDRDSTGRESSNGYCGMHPPCLDDDGGGPRRILVLVLVDCMDGVNLSRSYSSSGMVVVVPWTVC